MSARPPHVLLVGPYGGACGIGQFAEYWREALFQTNDDLRVHTEEDLHPRVVLERKGIPPVVVLNYHAALLSQWHPEHILEVQRRGSKVLTIWHDSGVPNSDHCKAICGASNHFVLHEPFDDLPHQNGTYLRQGVPAWEDPAKFWLLRQEMTRKGLWWGEQPVVGTVGLSLGYRNIDLLCRGAYEAGWGVLVLASRATEEEVTTWTCLNPACYVVREFLPKEDVVSYLAGCTATAQLLCTNNAGTSGGVRQCLAARRPLLALRSRQTRDLDAEPAIRWLEDGSPQGVAEALTRVPMGSVDLGIVRLAQWDSWLNASKVYANIIRDLLA